MREAYGWVSNQNANDTVLKNLHNLAESISSRSWKGKSDEEKKKTMLEIQKLREALNQVEKEIS